MSCDCIQDVDKRLKELNTRVTVIYPLSNQMRITPVIATERITNGRKPALLAATFCPFCGVKVAK